ncbi:MAG: DUF4352 domain-containing protein [Clostridia bacterium]|nr:DUF4352 domain-containing protein [Clostridia bacterium]
MSYRKWMTGFLMILVIALAGCGGDATAEATQEVEEAVSSVLPEVQESQAPAVIKDSGLVKCGEIYRDQELSYNILGVRTTAYDDGSKYLLLKMEVYNPTDEAVNFTPFDRFELLNDKNYECGLDIFTSVDGKLEGNIMSEHKILGEVAFDITNTAAEKYTLRIGKGFEYKSAIEIDYSNMDKSFPEQFENSDKGSEYTLGVPVTSDQLTIVVDDAKIEGSDKPGKEVLLIDISVSNSDSESINFMAGLNLNGVYNAEGEKLEMAVGSWTFPNDAVDSGATLSGTISYYVENGARAFYVTVTPDLDDYGTKVNIMFDVE